MTNNILNTLYNQVEAKYKNSSGDARIALREVLDIICGMDGEEDAGYDGEKLISLNQLMEIIDSEPCDVFESGNWEDIEYGYSHDALEKILENTPTIKAVPFSDYLTIKEKLENMTEAFADYVTEGVNNPAMYCANFCKQCVDGRGWCKNDENCRGFFPISERNEI